VNTAPTRKEKERKEKKRDRDRRNRNECVARKKKIRKAEKWKF
jgi:hypothetical protein